MSWRIPTPNSKQHSRSSLRSPAPRRIRKRSCAQRSSQTPIGSTCSTSRPQPVNSKGFALETPGGAPNLTGAYDKAAGGHLAGGHNQAARPLATTSKRWLICRRSPSTSRTRRIRIAAKQRTVSQDMVTNLQSTLNGSPVLASQIKDAVTQGHVQHFSLLDGSMSAGATYDGNTFPARTLSCWYDTYGFPIDLTELIAREQGDRGGSGGLREGSCRRRRSVRATLLRSIPTTGRELIHIKQSEFIGYDTLSAEVKIAQATAVCPPKGRV